jgi:hypothetical protein
VELFHFFKLQAQLSDLKETSVMYKSPMKDLKSAIKPAKRFHTNVAISTPSGLDERNFLSSMSLDSDFNLVDIPMDELKELKLLLKCYLLGSPYF